LRASIRVLDDGAIRRIPRQVCMNSPNCVAAPRISGVCEGTLTASFTAFLTPRLASSARARSSASA
jgi:alpha-galactosidase/6-phospho-beta-glucosidase family protein